MAQPYIRIKDNFRSLSSYGRGMIDKHLKVCNSFGIWMFCAPFVLVKKYNRSLECVY